ncbi:hypothetical protein [Acetobacterium bakii]|nr:hypothetical protein [Acetobacterium bakii]
MIIHVKMSVSAKFSGQNESVFCLHPGNDTDPILPIYLKINEDCLHKSIKALDGLGFFDIDEN